MTIGRNVVRKIILVVLLLVVLLCAWIGYDKYRTNTAHQRTSDKFIVDNKANESYALFGKRLSSRIDKNAWKTDVSTSSEFLHGSKRKLTSDVLDKSLQNIFGKTSQPHKITYQFTLKDSKVEMSVIVYKDGDVWKIGSLNAQ
jgi:hypothetical protein